MSLHLERSIQEEERSQGDALPSYGYGSLLN